MDEDDALKLALDALTEIARDATTHWVDEWCGELANKTLTAINALAQPAQEPVGKLQEPTVERAWFTIAELNAWADKKLSENPHWVMPKDEPERNEPPPQRPWVDLTGNEWFEWWRVSKIADETEAEIDFADFITIALAVSAKLKEKNNG